MITRDVDPGAGCCLKDLDLQFVKRKRGGVLVEDGPLRNGTGSVFSLGYN